MIINLYLFYVLIKDKYKVQKSVFISLSIYVASLFLSIITKTSSSTYLEGIGYKGYFESGNSLCTVLILAVCILLSNIDKKEWKKIILIIFTGIYLIAFSGMRTGLFGFSAVAVVFVLGKLFIAIRDNINLSKKQIITIMVATVLAIIVTFLLGAKTLERTKFLKQNEINNLDEETNSQRYVSGDVLNLYKQIEKGVLPENYMSNAEKQAIIDLNEYAAKIELSNVNLRVQQFFYNVFLIKHQKNPILILFGNGYKNQIGELVMEMEIPAALCNFGLFGLILYFGPVIAINVYGVYNTFKNRKRINIQSIMYLAGSGLAIALSTLSGYVYFNFSSMTMAIILNVFLLKTFEMDRVLNENFRKRTGPKRKFYYKYASNKKFPMYTCTIGTTTTTTKNISTIPTIEYITCGKVFIIASSVLSMSISMYSTSFSIISERSVCIPIFNISVIIDDAKPDFSNGSIQDCPINMFFKEFSIIDSIT